MGIKKSRDMQKEFNEWGEKISLSKLPKYEDLPKIELYMDQVIVLLEEYLRNFVGDTNENKLITSSMINNYVKQGMIPAPIKKKYNRTHLVYLLIICLMKPIISISIIHEMIEEQLLEHDINEILDMFCGKYEDTFNAVFEMAKKEVNHIKSSANENVLMGDMAISMAVSSSISKLIADNTMIIKNKEIKDNINSKKDNKKKKEK